MTMKKMIISLAIVIFTAVAAISAPPPPPQQNEIDGYGPPFPHVGAPIGSGVAIFLLLGSIYGGKKIYNIKREGI